MPHAFINEFIRFKSCYMNSHQGKTQKKQKDQKTDERGLQATSNPSNQNYKTDNKLNTISMSLLWNEKALSVIAMTCPYHESRTQLENGTMRFVIIHGCKLIHVDSSL